MKKNYLFTSESVSEGHPDKVCDRISDMVVDTYLGAEPQSRVACETLTTTNKVVLAGETRGPKIEKEELTHKVRECIKDIGYDQKGFSWKNAKIESHLHDQSSDIAMGVDSKENKDEGAGDQGLMFGYAVNETKSYMPLTIDLSHQLSKRLTDVRKTGVIPELRPDGKTQVSAEYADGVLKRIEAIVVSSQHSENFSLKQVQESIREEVINKTVPAELMDEKTKIYINPTGQFIIGGPDGDTGLTGRKIIVDTYGGSAQHGGGAFSGKDPTKVDRSAAYAARYVAKSIVKAKFAKRAEVQLSYAIGVANPISILIETFGTGIYSQQDLVNIIKNNFDLRPASILEEFDLRNLPKKMGGKFFVKTAAYGHFGREDLSLPWENVDEKVKDLIKFAENFSKII